MENEHILLEDVAVELVFLFHVTSATPSGHSVPLQQRCEHTGTAECCNERVKVRKSYYSSRRAIIDLTHHVIWRDVTRMRRIVSVLSVSSSASLLKPPKRPAWTS